MSEQKEKNIKFSDFMLSIGLSVTLDKKKIVSINSVSPGYIYSFSYDRKNYVIYTVATKKSNLGYYRAANTNNLLITGFSLPENVSPDSVGEGIKLLIKNMFYNKKLAKYRGNRAVTPISPRILVKLGNKTPGDRVPPISLRTLISVAGNDSFRTFNFKKIRYLNRYSIQESLELGNKDY